MFGSNIPMWAVLDQSEQAKKAGYYDLLYVDKNADGNLLQDSEKFTGVFDPSKREVKFSVGDLKDPCSGWVYGMFSGTHNHENWVITASAESKPSVRMSLTMDGSYRVSGPANGVFVFAEEKVSAPVQTVNCNGDLSFQIMKDQSTLTIGKTVDLRLRLKTGNDAGFHGCFVEQSSFPAETPVEVQLVFSTKDGESRVHKVNLTDRDGLFDFSGSLDIPGDALPGTAKLTLGFPGKPLDESGRNSYRYVKMSHGKDLFFSPTTLSIELVQP